MSERDFARGVSPWSGSIWGRLFGGAKRGGDGSRVPPDYDEAIKKHLPHHQKQDETTTDDDTATASAARARHGKEQKDKKNKKDKSKSKKDKKEKSKSKKDKKKDKRKSKKKDEEEETSQSTSTGVTSQDVSDATSTQAESSKATSASAGTTSAVTKKSERRASSTGGSESVLKVKDKGKAAKTPTGKEGTGKETDCLEPDPSKKKEEKIAVVTGGARGIGFAVVKNLCMHPRFNGRIYLTARTKEEGEAALRKLQMRGVTACGSCKVCYILLDVTECPSIKRLAAFIKERHGHLDILVNNAAVAFPRNFPEKKCGEVAECTIRTNYFGVVNLCDALFPLLRPHARVVNVSSSEGYLHRICSTELRTKLADPCLSEEELHQLMLKYIDDAKCCRELSEGWADTAYSVSKVAVSALSRIQQREFLREGSKEDVIVNHVHPGYVETDMTCWKGHLTPDEGSKAPVYAAMIPTGAEGPKGAYIWHDLSLVNWVDGPLPPPGY